MDLDLFLSATERAAHGWTHIYDPVRPTYFVDLPTVPWLLWPLSMLPKLAQWPLWAALSLALTLAGTWLGTERDRSLWLLALTASMPLVLTLLVGQMAGLILFLLGLAVWLLRRERHVWAGVPLAVAIQLEPATLAVVPLALLWTRQWRVLLGFAVAALAALAAYMAVLGVRFPLLYWQAAHSIGTGATTLGAALPRLGPFLGYLDRVPILALGGLALWRERDPIYALGVGVLASLLVTPYVEGYDLLALFVVAWMLQRRFGGRVAVAGFAALLVSPELTGWNWDVTALLVGEIGLLVWLALRDHVRIVGRVEGGGIVRRVPKPQLRHGES